MQGGSESQAEGRLRILNVMQCTNLGGMEQASLRLMRALKVRGHEIDLISLNPIGALGPLLAAAGISAVGLDYAGRGKLAAFVNLRRVLAAKNVDAMIMTGHNLTAFLALGGVCSGRRMLAIHYHHEGVMPAWQWRLIYGVARARFQAISFASSYVRHEAEALFAPIRSIAMTIPNPIEIPRVLSPGMRQKFRMRIDVPDDAPLIGNAGWLIKRKRFDVFLSTAAEVLARRPDAYFVIAGDGEERAALEQLSSALGIAERTRWTGWMTDLTPFYSSIDVLLFNTDWDAFGMTPVEAMAHGVPVVASVIRGGLSELLDDGCGWLLTEHKPGQLAACVELALTVEGCIRAKRAIDLLARDYDPDRIARQVEDCLLGSHG